MPSVSFLRTASSAAKSDQVELPNVPTGKLDIHDADVDEDEEAALAALEATMA